MAPIPPLPDDHPLVVDLDQYANTLAVYDDLVAWSAEAGFAVYKIRSKRPDKDGVPGQIDVGCDRGKIRESVATLRKSSTKKAGCEWKAKISMIRRTPSQWELVRDLDNTPDAGATSSPANSAGETAVPASRGQTRARGRARAPRGRPIVRAEADAPPRGRGGRGRGGRRAARGGSSRGAHTQAGEGVISQQNGQGDGQATGGTATEGGFDPFHNTF